MRILITGEKGFIARNLPKSFQDLGHEIVNLDKAPLAKRTASGEVCVHHNTEAEWLDVFTHLKVDLVVHNAAVVGTDVVALNPGEATLTNVVGTYRICRSAEKMGIPVCFMGTSVIYDTSLYQNRNLREDSVRGPSTLYGSLKLAGEHIVKSHCSKWLIIRPLFAYGGVGDMNSLIAKMMYAVVNDVSNVSMFLNPEKKKDYLHVEDFCDAVAIACSRARWNRDYNISADEPYTTGDIVDMISAVCQDNVSSRVRWFPETDYLGNHLLTSKRFRDETGWTPKYSLREGLEAVWKSIRDHSGDSGYDPLRHLNDAQVRGIDLTEYF
jgi:nucleoside-diphosphate-sugar epimerase